MATTISVAGMLTLNSDSNGHKVQDHVSVLDQGVDKTTNMWLEFDEDLVIHDQDPAVVSLSVVLAESLQKLTAPQADNTTDLLHSTESVLSEPSPSAFLHWLKPLLS